MPKRSDNNGSDKEVKFEELHSQVFPQLAGAVDSSTVFSLDEQAHVESCLRCQAELVRYRRVLRTLHDLRTTVIHPAPGLLADILNNLGERGEQRAIRSIVTGKRAAYAGGIAVATAAGVTGAVILAFRTTHRSSKKSTKKAA